VCDRMLECGRMRCDRILVVINEVNRAIECVAGCCQ
jgi:hypothetical protein